jgi:hypothetical protein
MDTTLEYEMATDALAVLTAAGKGDTPLAARARELQAKYQTTATSTGFGVADLVRLSNGEKPAKKTDGGQKATGSSKRGGATDKQRDFAKSLMNDRDFGSLFYTHPLLHEAGTRLQGDGPIDWQTCSELISVLKETAYRADYVPKAQRSTTTTSPRAPREVRVEEGIYLLGDDYVKVVHNQDHTRLYSKVWDGECWDYEQGRNLIYKLTPEMALTAEDAHEFGDLYGECCFCGLALTDERSISAGYGPTCASKHGLPWG